MNRKSGCAHKLYFAAAGVFFALFLLLTVLLLTADVKPMGPEGSLIGLSAINCFAFEFFGVNTIWYNISEILGYVSLVTVAGFALLGAVQLIRRRSFRRVDRDLYLLAALYAVLAAVYLLFELLSINFRPTLVGGELEASYPSSHTLLTVVIMGSTIPQLRKRLSGALRTTAVAAAETVMMLAIISRLLSGIHWLTDILGGILLGSALAALYSAFYAMLCSKKE